MIKDMNWKQIVIACIAVYITGVMLFIFTSPAFADVYARVGVITEINEEEDFFVVEDAVGFIWEISEVEDYCVGDVVAMVMLDVQGTESILDDIIISTTYSGYISADIK